MNAISKGILLLFGLFLILTILSAPVKGEIETGVIVNGSMYTDEPIEISISESGSKNYYAIDNSVGAKNKIVTLDNKDRYEINHYLKEDDGTTVELIYPNGKQNNANNKIAIVNGTETTQPRIYGKDGITYLTIVYDEYLHSEETVNFNNPIGNRFTSVSNNLGMGDSWSNNGKMFDNQISGLEFVVGETGNYSFSHWVDDFGNAVSSFSIDWLNGAVRNYNFTAIYDFFPNPVPVDNETEPVDNSSDINNETEPIENSTNNNTSENNTNITIPSNNSNSTDTNLNNTASNNQNNGTTLTNNEKTNNTVIASMKNTGNSLYIVLFGIALILIVLGFRRKYE